MAQPRGGCETGADATVRVGGHQIIPFSSHLNAAALGQVKETIQIYLQIGKTYKLCKTARVTR